MGMLLKIGGWGDIILGAVVVMDCIHFAAEFQGFAGKIVVIKEDASPVHFPWLVAEFCRWGDDQGGTLEGVEDDVFVRVEAETADNFVGIEAANFRSLVTVEEIADCFDVHRFAPGSG
jgi:hypothetical protein